MEGGRRGQELCRLPKILLWEVTWLRVRLRKGGLRSNKY